MNFWRHPAAAIAGITIVVITAMITSDMGPNVVLVAAAAALVGSVLWFMNDLASVAVSTDGVPTSAAPEPTVSADRRVARLRSGLAYGRAGDPSFERLYENLTELVDDQLLAAHQIDRAADPERARATIGDELHRFLNDPGAARTLAQPRTLDRVLTLVEAI